MILILELPVIEFQLVLEEDRRSNELPRAKKATIKSLRSTQLAVY